MADKRDPHGIVNFFVRYLVLHVIFLVGLPVSYAMDLALIYFFGFMGFFTFFQVLIAITRKFLEKAGSWNIVAIVGAVFSDVAVHVVAGRDSLGFFRGLQLGTRDCVAALPLRRCFLRVGTPRVLLLVEPARYCDAQRPCRCR